MAVPRGRDRRGLPIFQSPASILSAEQKTLLAESMFPTSGGFQGTGLPIVAVASLDVLMRRDAGWQGEALVRARIMPDALVIPLKGTSSLVQIWDDHRTLWVATENDNYRADYKAFVEKYFGLPSLPPSMHADHMYNRARAKRQGLGYIRMMAVPAPVNTSHGGGVEKALTNAEGERPTVPAKSMDDFMWMKALGIPSPQKGKPLSQAQQSYLCGIAKALGLPADPLEDNLFRRFNRAHGLG